MQVRIEPRDGKYIARVFTGTKLYEGQVPAEIVPVAEKMEYINEKNGKCTIGLRVLGDIIADAVLSEKKLTDEELIRERIRDFGELKDINLAHRLIRAPNGDFDLGEAFTVNTIKPAPMGEIWLSEDGESYRRCRGVVATNGALRFSPVKCRYIRVLTGNKIDFVGLSTQRLEWHTI